MKIMYQNEKMGGGIGVETPNICNKYKDYNEKNWSIRIKAVNTQKKRKITVILV